jgi:NAD(P) transhydrogenase subunit beta
MAPIYSFLFLVSAVLFILSLRGLSSAASSKRGNLLGILGMAIAICTTISLPSVSSYLTIVAGIAIGGLAGYIIAKKISMTDLPQLIAGFHSLVGLAAVLIAFSVLNNPHVFGLPEKHKLSELLEIAIGACIGAITFTGSAVAFIKLSGLFKKLVVHLPKQHLINALVVTCIVVFTVVFVNTGSLSLLLLIVLLSFALGWLLITPIGGADMPVIVSMLNSYSGWTAAGIGFTLGNTLLIIVGALVGTSGAILSYIMCKGMNRSLVNVVLGGFGSDSSGPRNNDAATTDSSNRPVKISSPEDAAFILKNADSIIVVPGYGMAVSHAQHAIKEISDICKTSGATVRFAIHPVAGRMPGHMNVLLAEANIEYEDVLEIGEINHDFADTDVVLVVGANDITNPAAKNDPTSPIYGMPVLDVDKSKIVLFVKRSLGSGYAGIDNPLFYQSNTMMVLGDAKKVCEEILQGVK